MSLTKKPLLLVHGAWAGGWVWERILPGLRQLGIDVQAPTLPGQMGEIPPEQVNLDLYVEFLAGILKAFDQPAVLVGHSVGGMVISQLAEAYPDLVDKLVYLGGMLLPTGMNYAEFCAQVMGPGAKVGASKVAYLDNQQQYSILDSRELYEIFYNCTPRELALQAINHLVPQPVGGWYLKNHLTEGKFGSKPRYYIRLGQDQTVLPELQDEMIRLTKVEKVCYIHTDHVPQLSSPSKLVAILEQLCAVSEADYWQVKRAI